MKTKHQHKDQLAFNQEQIEQAHDYLLSLGDFAMRFTEIERAPRYLNGDRENDVEHSFHLALSAAELAADYYPELDIGLVTQFSLVHDLPEFYCGDVWTIGISEKNRNKKEQAEKKASERLFQELPPHTSQLLSRYEAQIEPEARFVRFIDKLMPDIIHIINGVASTFKQDHRITNVEELDNAIGSKYTEKLQTMFPEFQFIHVVRGLVLKTLTEHLFQDK